MLALLTRRYSIILTISHIHVFEGGDFFSQQSAIATYVIESNTVEFVTKTIMLALESIPVNAKIYIRVGYPVIKTDILPPAKSYFTHAENITRAQFLLKKIYSEDALSSTVRVEPTKYGKSSVVEWIDDKWQRALTTIFTGKRFQLTALTSIHTWILNSIKDLQEFDFVLLFYDGIYTLSRIHTNQVCYVSQFQSSKEQATEVLRQQLKRAKILNTNKEDSVVNLLLITLSDGLVKSLDTDYFTELGFKMQSRNMVGTS